MVNLLSKNKSMQKATGLRPEIKTPCPNLYKLPGEAPLQISSIQSLKTHTLDFAKCFETLKEKMKYQGNLNLA